MTNRIHDAFDSVKADTRLKESTKQFLGEKYRERNLRPYRRPVRRLAFLGICMMFALVIGVTGYSWIRTPVSYVSIDVNPSIELALNRFDRVVSVTAYNMESARILDGLSLQWKKYSDAIHAVVECEDMRVYLTKDSELVLTVAADESRKNELETGVKRCAGHIGHGCHDVQTDISSAAQAHECGLSVGKYSAYLRLLEYDSTITPEDCKNMTMAEIRELILEYERENGAEKQDGSDDNNSSSNSNNSSNGNVTEENSSTAGGNVTHHKKRSRCGGHHHE